ncbi:hypothetical protein JOB18_021704 [Solea senegalensis]|uniref:Uncharacterized protein n=1 Tax=Solea senegalensis TaxID=28829 RepID=A0AAV6QPU8_SOLSE|nr:C-reactive protein-like [Solea senegalensis]KAG7494037.1 hypothetical protein JOB18_021704 [Solea senegalensis]
MKNKVLFALMVIISSLLATTQTTTTTRPRTTTPPSLPRANLNGKMFTLSVGGITFYSPYSTTPHSPQPATTSSPYQTTQPSVTGWSLCLRYLSDTQSHKILTICPSCYNSVILSAASKTLFRLSNGYGSGSSSNFEPNINFMSASELDIWTKVCVTVDNVKSVAQLFSGSNMSIRKMLRLKCSWTGAPTIRISGFDGQVTDVQMWDYPLLYEDVSNYMNYRDYAGSILTWSDIRYSPDGNLLLEDVYEFQAREPISRRRKGRRRKGGKKTRKGFTLGESEM